MARSHVDEVLAHPAVRAFLDVSPQRAGIFCDFDGTLAPIVDDPRLAKPARGAAPALRRLAATHAVVAVISGRPVRDLSRMLRVPRLRLVGIHGLEERDGAGVRVSPAADRMRESVERAAAVVEPAVRSAPGVALERKGLSVAVHFRRAADPDAAEALVSPIVHAAAAAEGLGVAAGRRVLEMRPVGGGDKGDALTRLIQAHDLKAVLVAGDDAGDLALFAAAAAVPVACRIGIVSSEAPAGLVESTDVILPGPSDFVALLQRLA